MFALQNKRKIGAFYSPKFSIQFTHQMKIIVPIGGVGTSTTAPISAFIIAQIATRSLLSWLISFGFFYSDPSSLEIVAV